jgi:hypothetical protein
MVVTRHKGRTFLTLRGPETRATLVDCPADGEWLGIRLKLGAFLTRQPVYEAGYYDQAHMTAPSRLSWPDARKGPSLRRPAVVSYKQAPFDESMIRV